MSKTTLEQIIGRMVLDKEFRQLMSQDRDAALSGYDLTDEERAGLASLDATELHGAASTLGERVSKGMTLQ